MATGRAPRILAFAGSTRAGSFNKKLVAAGAVGAANAGAEVTHIDLADFPMPLYDGDLETAEGLPPESLRLREIMTAHDGFLISSPEYNSGYSAVLKNSIDWVSRPIPDEPPLAAFAGKVAGLMAASPGAGGGSRVLVQLRMLLSNINMLVIPDHVTLPTAHKAFAEDGTLVDPKMQARAEAVGARVAEVASAIIR